MRETETETEAEAERQGNRGRCRERDRERWYTPALSTTTNNTIWRFFDIQAYQTKRLDLIINSCTLRNKASFSTSVADSLP